MQHTVPFRWTLVLGALAAWLGGPAAVEAQSVSGHARAVQASVRSLFGVSTTALADTGTLSGATDAREASQPSGAVAGIVSGNTLHASTIGWADQVASESSVGDVAIRVAGAAISAAFVMSRAVAVPGGGAGMVNIDGLSINGIPIDVSGTANQIVWIPGGRVVINEQRTSSSGTEVNALHVVVDGVADVTIASATARIQ